MEGDVSKEIENLVSPSDMALLDLLFDGISNLKKILDIFRDRNPERLTLCLRFAVITTAIEGLFGIKVDTDDVIGFISGLNEKEIEEDGNEED